MTRGQREHQRRLKLKEKGWDYLEGLWPYCGIWWLDRLSFKLGDFIEAQQFHWSEWRIEREKRRRKS